MLTGWTQTDCQCLVHSKMWAWQTIRVLLLKRHSYRLLMKLIPALTGLSAAGVFLTVTGVSTVAVTGVVINPGEGPICPLQNPSSGSRTVIPSPPLQDG